MSEKEEKQKTDIKGEVKYHQNRVASGHAPHNLIELETEKYRKAISENESVDEP